MHLFTILIPQAVPLELILEHQVFCAVAHIFPLPSSL